jgi:hypothetical protein
MEPVASREVTKSESAKTDEVPLVIATKVAARRSVRFTPETSLSIATQKERLPALGAFLKQFEQINFCGDFLQIAPSKPFVYRSAQ